MVIGSSFRGFDQVAPPAKRQFERTTLDRSVALYYF